MAKVFSEGAKVFAKVRGYPAWPAMVQGVADSTPNKTKYHVFFYGTSETAVCKAEDLYLYAENKDRFGKPLKRKGFNEALQQIEGRAPVTMPKNDEKIGEGDSDVEGNLVIDENPSVKYGEKKSIKRKRESGPEENDGKLPTTVTNGSIVRKRSSAPIPKRSKRESLPRETIGSGSVGPSTPDSKTGEAPSSPNKPEIISRSGRKIKPKKFADEETFDHTSTSPVDTGIPVSKLVPLDAFGAGVKRRQSSTRHSGSDAEGEKERSEERGHDQREGDMESTQSQIAGKRVRHDEEKKIMIWGEAMERRKARLKWLKSEARMVELDALIKGHLSLTKANPEHCLGLLDDMCNLTLEPLMLKKHPHIVETIKRLRRYVGNVDAWNLTPEQKAEFISQAGSIRNKAEFVYNKFKAMFTVPEGRTFWQVFADDVNDFQRKTQDWPMNKVYALVVDPTMENKSQKSSNAEESSRREQSDGESDGTGHGSGTRSSPLTNAAADSDSERANSGDEGEDDHYEKSLHNLDSSDPTSEDADQVE